VRGAEGRGQRAEGRRDEFGRSVRSSLAACLLLGIALAHPAFAASFDEQRDAMAKTVATQPESAIVALLQAGVAEGKSVLAMAETQRWLAQNRPKNALLFYHAGRAAELSGDWKGAVSLYQQYLAAADLKSDTADEAVYVVYTLLIERLGDTAGAYAFGRNEGNRLLVCPRARQFDQWFLDEGVKRNDVGAVAERLYACIATGGLPDDLLIARYGQYFRWLQDSLVGYCEAPNTLKVTASLLDTTMKMAGAITFNDELKLNLAWLVSIRYYNQQKIAGKEVAPPVAEATALLATYPQYAQSVQDGWAGGGNGRHYRNDPKLYWPHEVDAKMAPIVAAVAKLDPLDRAPFMQSWRDRYYDDNVVRPAQVKGVREYLQANPELINSRAGVLVLDKPWDKYSPEEAQKLAAQLDQNPYPEASLIRSIAAGGRDYDKVMAALLGLEVWRLGPAELNGGWPDQLWHYCGRPGGNQKREEAINKSKALAAAFAAGDAKKDDPVEKRVAAFKTLWADYTSSQPKLPAVRTRLIAVLRVTPEAVPQLLKVANPDAHSMLKDALAAGMEDAKGPLGRDARVNGVSSVRFDPWINRLAGAIGGMDRMRPDKDRYRPHPLEPVFRAALAEGLKQNRIESWQVMAWINLQFPEDNAEQVKLMTALAGTPPWQAMPFEVQFGAREWFKKEAMTPSQIAWVDAADVSLVCKDLLALTKDADASVTASALNVAIDGARKSPVKLTLRGLDTLATVSDPVFADPMVFARILEIIGDLRFSCDRASEAFGGRLLSYVTEKRDSLEIHRAGAFLWSFGISEHYARSLPSTLSLAQSLFDTHPASACALARAGLASFARGVAYHSQNWYNGSGQAALKALDVKASMKLGLMVIPVAKNDPAYPVYQSQMDWMGGNEDSAWRLCEEHWEPLLPLHRELSIDYLMWVLQRTIYSRDEVRQEALIKALQGWAAESGSALSTERKVEIELAYGDIAVQRGMLKQAQEIFQRTAANKAFDGVLIKHEATLRKARVERMAKDYDGALNTLNELAMEKVPELWSPIRYAMAEVYYDMEDFNGANDQISTILDRESDHSDAKIMQGKLQIKRQKLMEATELEIGPISSKQTLVPGEKLKVTLSDPTLAVSGAGTEIEVVVWATSGDRERFFLRQFGDQKTKFRGEVATVLGAPAPDDRVLQVIGEDEIYYAYSDRFRAKMNNMEEKRGGPIAVASDALLMVSGRRLLSEAEQRVADMQAQMETLNASAAAIRVRQATAADAKVFEADSGAPELQEAPVETRLKPEKPIHVRVIDHDRSRTAQIDEVQVSISTSSGDSIGGVVLKETGTHTGWFEGRIPTAGAQAMANAANSEPGRNPNMVISPKTDYPPWRPVAVAGAIPEFRVDLNDNVVLGEMSLTAGEPGATLRKFVLQAGMSDREMMTVGVYPQDMVSLAKPWHPSVTIMNDTDRHHNSNDRSVYDIRDLEEQLDRGWMTQQFAQGVAANVAGLSEAMTSSIPARVAWKRQNRYDTSHVIYRFRGYFYETGAVSRRFKLELGTYEIPKNTHPSVNHPAQFLLAVDGRPITSKEQSGKLDGSIDLQRGLHRFEIWATGWNTSIGFDRRVKLLANLGVSEPTGDLIEVPASFFDPAVFPAEVLPHRNSPATISASKDGTEFTVKFAPDSRARLLKLAFLEQEGPVPVLNKITLRQPDGKTVLPVKEDFAELNKNSTLEILTGDKVTVRYVDDRFVTHNKETHERFLDVMFSNAQLDFQFFEMRKDRFDNDEPYYEQQLRFAHGQPVLLTVTDPDMDISPDVDTVTISVESSDGGQREFKATEDKDEPGTFRVWIKPVTAAAVADDEIKVGEGGTLTAIYRDAENTEPGVPTDRQASIRHAAFASPVLRLSHSTVTPIDFKSLPHPLVARELRPGFDRIDFTATGEDAPLGLGGREVVKALPSASGTVLPRWTIQNGMFDAGSPPAGGFAAVHGQMMYFEIEAAHLALRMGSVADVFVQTHAGRAVVATNAAAAATMPFDITVPGTMQLKARMAVLERFDNLWHATPQIPIYIGGYRPVPPGSERGRPRNTALFQCEVPLIAGALPETGVMEVSALERRELGIAENHGLVVRPDETVYVGFRYTAKDGSEQWITGSAKVITHPVLDVLEEDHRTAKKEAYVGENIYLRVVDLGADRTDGSDKVSVLMQAKSGAKLAVELLEVDTHSGIFKAAVPLTYTKKSALAQDYDVRQEGFPLVYGDMMGCLYASASGQKTPPIPVMIRKGADGDVVPFSKTYDDPDIAMRTQFALAEGFLEMAKHHRVRGEEDEAGREYDQARRLLAAVVDQFREAETRAHAEYLLGNLTQEEADATEAGELQQERYRAALARFMNVTGSYPDTVHASKAQFKIATVYEKLNEPDIAAQEYVKLAYKYPQSEFLAMSMARLGTHFLRKADTYEKKAAPLLEQVDNKDAQFEGAAMNKMAVKEYLNAGSIFASLLKRFPSHELAGQGGLRAGQAYMRAESTRQALQIFLAVVDTESYDGPEIRAQAMYWAGMCYERLREPMAAYAIYKRLTYDFPESTWAAYARGQLSQEGMVTLDTNLEIKRLEEQK